MSSAEDRLADLYAANVQAATRLAYLLTADRQAAEDIAQEAFVRLGGRLLALREPDKAAGYLMRTVANLARDHGRRLKREDKLEVKLESNATAPLDRIEVRDEVLSAMMRLTPRHRMVLFLRYYLDMSEEQAAQALGSSTSAIKSLTNRASVALRRQLGGDAG